MCWEKPKVLKYAAGFQLVGNVLQLRNVGLSKLLPVCLDKDSHEAETLRNPLSDPCFLRCCCA